MRAFGCLLALLLCVSPSAGQIVVKERYEIGEPIVAEIQLPKGGKVAWRGDAGSSVINVGLNRAHVWATPGKHVIEAVLVSMADGELSELKWEQATYSVGDAPPAPPEPEPPGPQPPGPEPPGPEPPEPQPGTLGALVPDANHRALLAEFYAEWAGVIRGGAVTTTGNFREALRKGAETLRASGKLPTVPQVNKPISDLIAAAVGLEDAPLDATKRAALVAVLERIAREFKGG